MTALAPTLQAFFTDRLLRQRHASPHTVACYRDTFRLLLKYLHTKTGKAPARLLLEDLDAATIGAFMEHLQTGRGNSVSTRNIRLAAIHSFFNYAAFEHPQHAALIQRVLAIPPKRFDTKIISYLVADEIDALLAVPDRTTWTGRRDHAIVLLAAQAGLRASELVALRCQDLELGSTAHVDCLGKGRKERTTPLDKSTAAVLRVWLRERNGQPPDPLFPSQRGDPLTRGAIWRLVTKHAAAAQRNCPSLATKHVTPHVLRHTCAMTLLQNGVDVAVIALWLGHADLESTNIYIHANQALKERALARTTPPNTPPGRYRPSDDLLAFLDRL